MGLMGQPSSLSAPGRHRSGDSHPAVQLPFLPPSGHGAAESRPKNMQFSRNMPAHTRRDKSRQVALRDDIRPLTQSSFVLYMFR